MTTTAARPAPAPARREPRERLRDWQPPLGLTSAQLGGLVAGLGALVLLLAAVLGPTAALLTLAGVAGLLVLAVAIAIPTLSLGLLVATEFANVSGVYENKSPVSIYVVMLGIAAASAVAGLARRRYRERIRPGWWIPAALLLAYLVTLVPATVLSQAPEASAASLSDSLKDVVFVLVTSLLLQMSNRPWATAVAIVVPLVIISGLTALNEYVVGNSVTFGGFSTIASASGADIAAARHAGPLPDSNFWGRFLVLGLPFAMALVHRASHVRSRRARVLWTVVLIVMLLGIYLTQSRGTLLASGVAVFVWIVATGPLMRRRAFFLAPSLLLVALLPGIGDRLLTLTQTVSSPDYAADPSLVERSNVGVVAFGVFRENVLFGTGPGSFATVMARYAPLTDAGPTGDITATHNLYLEIASESGIVGLAGWAVLIGGILLLGIRSVIRLAGAQPEGPGGRATRAMAAAGVAAVLGWSAASAFLHLSYSRPLLLVCSMVGFVYSASRADPALAQPRPTRLSRQAVKGLWFAGAVTAATAVAATVVAATLLTALGRDTYVATTDLTLQATGRGYPGYATDIRRRVHVLPAYASMIQGSAATQETTVAADPPRGIMTVTAVADTPQEAVARRDRVVAGAPASIHHGSLDTALRVVTVSVHGVTEHRVVDGTTQRIVLLATAAEIALVLALCARIRREERRRGVWLL